jgi:hypothetical protein
MFHIRTTKTASGATAVQIIRYKNRKMLVVKHLGSAHGNRELKALKETASIWIEKATKQPSFFSNTTITPTIELKQCRYIGFRYALVYESLHQLLIDLVIARIIEPGSKLQSIEFLKEFTGVEHRREYFYRQLPKFLSLKNAVESKALAIAKEEFAFDFSMVFYDVTTVYFESSKSDNLRQCGFSKNNKFNQPQIILGLLVNTDGFPVGYQKSLLS